MFHLVLFFSSSLIDNCSPAGDVQKIQVQRDFLYCMLIRITVNMSFLRWGKNETSSTLCASSNQKSNPIPL